jgi:tetratricopeptide (TPR) repeat protein
MVKLKQMQTGELMKQFEAACEMRKRGNSSSALSEFESLERQSTHPQDIATLRLFQTMCLTDLERVDEATERISQVDKNKLGVIDQSDYESEYAYIKRAKGMTNEALDHVCKAIDIANSVEDQRQVETAIVGMLALKGILLSEAGRCDEAIFILQRVPSQNSWWGEAMIHLGDCKIRKRLHKEAIEIYLSIILSSREIDPIHRKTAIRNIGCAYYYMKEYAKALEYLTRVEHSYDEDPSLKAELFGMIASTYSSLGMPQMAAMYSVFSRGSDSIQ